MDLSDFIGLLYGEWSTTSDIFLAFLTSQVCPNFKKGDVVIMDNAAIHKVTGVRELIENRGARLLYLPPYSPNFSPIENAWSKLKAILIRLKNESLAQFQDALISALREFAEEDFSAWFEHCDYGTR